MRKNRCILLFLLAFIHITVFPDWTIMVYLNGDNNLEQYAIDDFLEISSSEIDTEIAKIIVQFDRIPGYDNRFGNWTSTKRFYIDTKGMTPDPENALEDIGEANMGDPDTLRDFIVWGIDNYPADKYVLIIWDHGESWYKGIDIQDISFDETSGNDSIKIAGGDLKRALKEAYLETGEKIDILGIDACKTQTLTLSGEVFEYVDLVIASVDYIPGTGWNYTPFLNHLFENNGIVTPEDLGFKICETFSDEYQTEVRWNSISLLRMSEFTNFMQSFNDLTELLIVLAENNRKEYVIAMLDKYEIYNYNGDLGFFLEHLSNDDEMNIDIRDSALIALNYYNDLVGVSYGRFMNGLHYTTGISIYFGNDETYRNSYLSREYLWDDFLFFETEDRYKVYPNPAYDSLVVKGLLHDETLSIYTIDGKRLFYKKKPYIIENISLKRYPSGVYILVFEDRDNNRTYKKLAKVK